MNLRQFKKIARKRKLTYQECMKFVHRKWWKNESDYQIVKVQLFQDRCCVDWGKFREAIEKVLGRPVWTHEFAWIYLLREEFNKKRKMPSFEEIISLIPKEKLIVITR